MPFPVLESSVTARNTVASTTHTITLPSGIVPGEMLFVLFAVDPSPNSYLNINVSSGTGWKKMNWSKDGSVLSSAIFWKIADGVSDSLTISTSSSEVSVHASFRISGSKSFAYSVSIASYPPSPLTAGAQPGNQILDLLINVNEGNLSSITPPSTYTLVTSDSSPNTSTGASLAIASKNSYGSGVEDPGTWSYTYGGGGGICSWHIAFSDLNFEETAPSIIAKQETILSTSTSHDIVLPDSIVPGNLIFVHFVSDIDTSITIDTGSSGNGWNIIASANQPSTGPASLSLYKVATGSDTLTLTTSSTTISKSISYQIANASHIIGNSIGGASGNSVDWDDANSLSAAVWNPGTLTGHGGTWQQAQLLFNIFSYKLGTYFYTLNLNGSMVNDANNISIITNEYTAIATNNTALTWNQLLASTTDSFNVSIFTVFPKYYKQIRLVGGQILERAGNTTSATMNYGSSFFLPKITETSAGVYFPERSFSEDGLVVDDLILALSAVGTSSPRNPSLTPSGFTTLSETISTGSTYRTKLWVGYKFITRPVDTDITFPGSGNLADGQVAGYIILRNINRNNPFLDTGSVVERAGTGTGIPTDYTSGTYRGAANTRTGLPIPTLGNSYLRIAASSGSGTGLLFPPVDNYYFFGGSASDTNSINASISFVDMFTAIDGWANGSSSLNLYQGWSGGITGAGNSWIEVLVPLNVQPKPINGCVLKTYTGADKDATWNASDFMLFDEDTGWNPKPMRIWDGNKWITYTTNQYF